MQEPRNGHKSVWVFGEVRGGRIHPVTLELAGQARELADDLKGQVSVLLAGGPLEEDPRLPLSHGADRVLLVEHPSLREPNPEVAAKVLAALVTEEKPEIVLAPATAQGRSVLPAAAAWLCTECLIEDDVWGTLCDKHAKTHPHGNYGEPIPLVNSPRLGMCGYDGPAEPPF